MRSFTKALKWIVAKDAVLSTYRDPQYDAALRNRMRRIGFLMAFDPWFLRGINIQNALDAMGAEFDLMEYDEGGMIK